MGYYNVAGDYYRAGDYYTGQGDFWSSAKKGLKKVARSPLVQQAALGLLPGGSVVKGIASSFVAQPTRAPRSPTQMVVNAGMSLLGLPALVGATSDDVKNCGPKGNRFNKDGRPRKCRSLNPANVSALRRALRRVDSFRVLAKKSGALPAARRLPPQRAASCCK